jgi:hypothetical protein
MVDFIILNGTLATSVLHHIYLLPECQYGMVRRQPRHCHQKTLSSTVEAIHASI